MDFDSIGAFAMFISIGGVGLGLVWLAAHKAQLKARIEELKLGGGESNASVEQLREEMHQALSEQAAEIDDLNERLDFAERLLTKGKQAKPKETTPVS